ncbi:MAG: hypothetical protein CYPHOPRED_000725 [Cyphobasidiales sp. Tagirdzhanova-0007]|nr:MAG: hypothetical protein CYPHOPRED_000725 [Cyphobasidiales sp. Tagirdzhanova-0007]
MVNQHKRSISEKSFGSSQHLIFYADMRWLCALLAALAVTPALADRKIAIRQQSSQVGPLIYSPPNLTVFSPGEAVNFAYLASANTTMTIEVVLIQETIVAQEINMTENYLGNPLVSANLVMPANLAQGSYMLAVRELSNFDSSNDGKPDYQLAYYSPTNDLEGLTMTVGNGPADSAALP